MLSVLASAILAVAEVMFSGVRVPGPVLGVSLGLFLVSSALEGAITVAVLEALEAVNPEFVRRPGAIRGSYAMGALGAAAVLLAVFGVMFASTHPDGLEKLAHDLGIAERTTNVLATPLADYQVNFLRSPWLRKAAAGFAGLVLIYGACLAVGKVVTRNRRV
jgi:cobalt/nickel transport system permease protein